MQKNDTIELEIQDIAEDGSGIGRHDGMVVFCRGLLPGECGLVKIIKVTKSYAIGKLLSRITSSADRIEPPICGNFGKGCGGCAFCHWQYTAQLSWKRRRVIECLQRIAGIPDAAALVSPVLPAQQPLHYRNKSIYPFTPAEGGGAACGFYALNSHRVVPILDSGCGLENEMSRKIREFTCGFMSAHGISVYDERTGSGILRNLMVRTSHRGEPEAMVVLVINEEDFPVLEKYAASLRRALPFVASVFACFHPEHTNVVLNGTLHHISGALTIQDTIGNFTSAPSFDISPLSFYQVNPLQMERLYETIYEFLPDSGALHVIYDIYCGIGTIGIYLMSRLARDSDPGTPLPSLIGLESVPAAVADARKNAQKNGIENAAFYCGDAKAVLPEAAAKHGVPSVVILDPPRKGCDAQLIETVLASGTKHVLYVSCNPATLARDLKQFYAAGFTCGRVQPVDMFPQSGHVETVCLMSMVE